MSLQRLTLHRLHKWAGLSAALWLAVLGTSGFILDHRDNWRWLWHAGLSANWLAEAVVQKSQDNQISLYQQHPQLADHQVAGGKPGLWWRDNSGAGWQQSHFIGVEHSPMVAATFFDQQGGLWLATDQGVWFSGDQGKTIEHVAMFDKNITALAPGFTRDNLLGVVDRSAVFSLHTAKRAEQYLQLQPPPTTALPHAIDLSRFVRDLHYGRGVFSQWLSLLWNDISGIALLLIPLSGFLFFWLPRRWRKQKQQGIPVTHQLKKQSMRWLFRLHAPGLGLLTALPIIYLSLSGVILDHEQGLRNWLKSVAVTRAWQTPVYNLQNWQGEIYNIVARPDLPGAFSVGTRVGLFTSTDQGNSWVRENFLGGKALFIWSLHQYQDTVLLGGMGGPNFYKQGSNAWQVAKGSGHMPSDMSVGINGEWLWKSRHGVKVGNPRQGFKAMSLELPALSYVPWFYVIDGLHSGMLIHSQWKWINDLFALLAIFLVITGLIRWWNKKWI